MRTAQGHGPDAAAAEGLAIAREVLAAIRPLVQGVQIVAPAGEFAPALALAREAVAG
jgi:homocysteine S-methyltransferase